MGNETLVKDLRVAAEAATDWPDDATLMNLAADEIEYLREEVVNLTARLWNCQHEHPVDAIARRSDTAY